MRKFFSKYLNIIKHIYIAQTYLINRLTLYIINLDEYTQSNTKMSLTSGFIVDVLYFVRYTIIETGQ